MSFKAKRALTAPTEMASEIELVMVSRDDNLVFENEVLASALAPMEQLEFFERFAQTRLALQDVVPDEDASPRRAMGAFIHEASLRWLN